MKAGVGGTFNVLHLGHKTLLKRASELADELVIGLVSDKMAKSTRESVTPYESRKATLAKFLQTLKKPFQIVQIDDPMGPASSMQDLDMIVVSEGTQKNAEKINFERIKKGLGPLKIEVIPTVLAQDFKPIKASRIIQGEIDETGKLLIAFKANVGSINPVKIDAVRNVFTPLYAKLEVKGIDVNSGVPKQPKEAEVLQGAINRAKGAIQDAHVGVGIEAGLLWDDVIKWYFDVQYCVIIDSVGRMTIGHGSGFYYPPAVIEEVEEGLSVDKAMKKITGIDSIGHKQGSVGFLSNGLIDRTKLTEQAVIAAMIPRMKPELYYKVWRKP